MESAESAESKACSNCEGVLCSNAIGDPGCISGPHHAHLATWTSTSPANAECTRSPVLRVEGCLRCQGKQPHPEYPSALICVWWRDGDSPSLEKWIHLAKEFGPAPDKCPLKGKGITLKAAVKKDG